MTDVVGYVRVSTDEQAASGAGLSAQRAAIHAEAARRGWTVVEVIEDAGYSGKSMKRPGIAKALEVLKQGRADTLVVAKLDRLSRSMLDFSGLMERATKEHWALVALDVGVDTTTPQGEMMANVMAVFAQFERKLIGQRTKESLAVKRREGVRLGRPRKVPAEVVARIRSERARGSSLTAIADRLNASGVPTAHGGARWYVSTVSKVLASNDPTAPEIHARPAREPAQG
ncbi:MAG: recombinase family protein [Chloroflexi bacterium]|nr:recombinase family protein [Chloroflexota bacterium]